MPVIDDVGQSSNTEIKLQQLAQIFATHIAITYKVSQKYEYFKKTYLYIDGTAGPGTYFSFSEKGSPVQFAECVLRAGMPYEAHLIDKKYENVIGLRDSLPDNFNFNTYNERYEVVIPDLLKGIDKYQLGLVYIDPNADVDLDTVKYVAHSRPCMEILLYLGAANLKRMGISIGEYATGKHVWLIRKPQDKQQWTFMLGTNARKTFLDKFKSIEMHSIADGIGRVMFDRMAYTKIERQIKCQLSLIGPTENISSIPDSSLSEPKLSKGQTESVKDAAIILSERYTT